MRILLVEDDQKLNYSLKYQLEKSNFIVDSCFDGEEALLYIEQSIHDIILLDRMLPLVDGYEVLTNMRKNNNTTPVILITALGTLEDKVSGLDCGADDYLVKPFAFEELLARIRCINRRPHTLNMDNSLHLGDLTLFILENRLQGPNTSCSLSKKENELFQTFLRNPNQVLTRETLFNKVWGGDSNVENGNLDNYIHFLRRRLHVVGSHINIQTVRGIGYCIQTQS